MLQLKLKLRNNPKKAGLRKNISSKVSKHVRSKAKDGKKSKKELKRDRKRREMPDEARKRAMSDEARMWKLRMKFLSQAKRYFGVPYARKYWTPEDAEYHSPLFLDCCGLVRKVLRDLRHQFGFRVGPWNQSYLCDTLPITIEREEDMKPGDLVFISAIYNNPKSKKQKHNLTHVEIWLGEGVKTIGARWQKGKVQVFDSYRFDATSYHSPTYIFKSIDTWLMGICRSHCPEHTWRLRSATFDPSPKSVFALTSSTAAASEGIQGSEDQSASAAGSDAEDDNNVIDDLKESMASCHIQQSGSRHRVDSQLLSRLGRARSLPVVTQSVETGQSPTTPIHYAQPLLVRRSKSNDVITKTNTSTVSRTSDNEGLDLLLPPVSVL